MMDECFNMYESIKYEGGDVNMNELILSLLNVKENLEDVKAICLELADIVQESYQFLLELDEVGTMNQEELNELLERIEEVIS